MTEIKNIKGQKFGRLKVISFKERRNLQSLWNCVCDCGNKIVASNNNLSKGHTRSCGCLGRETNSKRMFIHGFAVKKEQFYNIFSSMKQRCDNPNQKKYPIYGGRGIKYEWKSFQEFHNDMYKSYKLHVNKYGKRNTSIDRINNNGNYNKENCRWATYKEQARNKQNNTLITFNNKTHCVAEWCEIFNIKSSTFLTRIIRQKWTIEKAFTQPVRKRK